MRKSYQGRIDIFDMCTTKTNNRYIKHVPLAPLSKVTRCEEKSDAGKGDPLLAIHRPVLGYKRAKPFEMSGVGHDRHSVIVDGGRELSWSSSSSSSTRLL
jgi:hypothetical protein